LPTVIVKPDAFDISDTPSKVGTLKNPVGLVGPLNLTTSPDDLP
jgi:hypothetical protein